MQVQNFFTLQSMKMNEWILAARRHAQLTQTQLGEHLGVSKGNVWAWEKGNHEASLDQLVRIARFTGYAEPLPGTTGKPSSTKEPSTQSPWLFAQVDERKARSLGPEELIRLEAAFLIAAAQVGIDIKKDDN